MSKRQLLQNPGGSSKKPRNEENKKSSSAQKREMKKDRQSNRRHSEAVVEAKGLWNKLRLKSNTPEEIKGLMQQVMTLIQGKVNEISLQHDASRVVQAAVQFGSDRQRKELLLEILQKGDCLPELSKIQYAHFLALKFIKYCAKDRECVKMIVKTFKGHIPKLAVHAVGSRVVESIFVNFPPKETAILKQEFYGPHFSLFAGGFKEVPTLKSNLESATTENQKDSAMTFVKEIISKGISKSFFGYTFFQGLLAELMDVSEPGDIQEMAPALADHSIHLLSTRAGARVVASIASYGTPKDRKRVCKSLKGYTASSLMHRDAYLALIRLVQVTDDTVSIQKSILNEILASQQKGKEEETGEQVLVDLASSDTASKFFLFLLAPDSESRMKYFDPYERSILEPIPEINGVCTYKKEPGARRHELLKHMKQQLVDMCIANANNLLDSIPGSRLLKEVYNNFGTQELVDAIMEICESAINKEAPDDELSVFEDPNRHRAIKNLIVCDSTRDDPIFATAFFERLQGDLMKVASSNRGAFIVASLFNVKPIRPKLVNVLKSQQQMISNLSSNGKAKAGYNALLKELSN
ncbi:unnamed protein product [Cylindrotheca closterium]|uniref:PUM-HD domain-containing protein n=1 Tax=Cylindrotheca closterium TaxID=2856 RepID=A0AAD2CEB6_9STRA|nr:unnamed protein product [Cylindrotheca closterium]